MTNDKAGELFKEFKQVHSKINRIRKKGVRESSELDKLLGQRGELEIKLSNCLSSGGRLSDPLLDYCFAKFDGYSCVNPFGKRNDSDSAFDVVSLVNNFEKDVKKYIDQKILESCDSIPKRLGIISGNCFFGIDGNSRGLYVPVRNLREFNKGKWQEDSTKSMEIDPEIFSYPANLNILDFSKIKIVSHLSKKEGINLNKTVINGTKYETDHSGIKYFGGSAPKETAIYIGNGYVDRFLKDKEVTIKTERTIRIPIPDLFL